MLDIFSPGFADNPYPIYAELHKSGTVHRGVGPMPEFGESWYVIGFDEGALVSRSSSFVYDKSSVTLTRPLADFSGDALDFWSQIAQWPLIQDDPEHAQGRAPLAESFKQTSIQQLSEVTAQISAGLLKKLMKQGEFDVLWDYAYPLSTSVICNVLGITVPDIRWFKKCTNHLALSMDFQSVAHDYKPSLNALAELTAFLREQLRLKRETPNQGLLSRLGHTESFSDDFILTLALMVLVVGQETTADAMGNGLLALSTHPEVAAQLRNDTELIRNAVREMLRYESSVQFTGLRTATESIKLGGINIKKGDAVIVANGAANRDPRRFLNPDQFNIERDHSGPELVFGQGIHYCLGVHLARLELNIAIADLMQSLPEYWSVATFKRRETLLFRGLNTLKVTF